MIREIKSITLGSAYDFIELDRYTSNKDLIKVKFEDTGEDFTKWTLNDFGILKIELGTLDYKQYENPHDIKMVVEYEPSELPLSLDDIDTLGGLKKNIVDLKSFDYVKTIRLIAYRKFNIRLNEFILFNAVLFDQFGQTMKLKYDNQNKYSFNRIMALEDFRSHINEFSCGNGAIPTNSDSCPHCNQKWSLNNIIDCIQREGYVYHLDCNRFNLYEKVKKEFDYIASRAFMNYEIHAVKNEYGSEDYNGCWFIITTSEGEIKIGWRKKVIQIEWLQNYRPFEFDGIDEDVTREFSNKERYIHAWNIEKAIEYLIKAKITVLTSK